MSVAASIDASADGGGAAELLTTDGSNPNILTSSLWSSTVNYVPGVTCKVIFLVI